MPSPKQKWIYHFHWPLFLLTLLLLAAGLFNLKSAAGEGSVFWDKQQLWLGFGLATLLLSFFLSEHVWQSLSLPLYGLCLLLLVAVYLFGHEVGGQQNWLKLGSVRFQPSELAKLATILCLARHFAKYGKVESFKDLILPGLYALLPCVLVLAVGDLGGASFFVLILLTFYFLAGAPKKLLLFLLIAGLLSGYAGYRYLLKDYQIKRIEAFLHPEKSRQDYGYQLLQGRIAVGSGGYWGKGYTQGSIHQLKFLPAKHTDYVFPVLAEEWGLLGSSLVLVIFLLFCLCFFHAASKVAKPFSAYVLAGLGSLLFWQCFLNLGGVLGLLPLAGVTLPFFSYGGSALVINLLGVGIGLGLYVRRYTF